MEIVLSGYICIMKKITALFPALISLMFFTACTGSRSSTSNIPTDISTPGLKFLDTISIPFGKNFQQTTIGGISGIDYDSDNDLYYMISDDRSNHNPARFYTAKIHLNNNKFDSIEFTAVHFLKDSSGKNYPNSKIDPYHTPDPESIRFWKTENRLVWSSEGEKTFKRDKNIIVDPSINIADHSGKWLAQFPIPQKTKMSAKEKGPRVNGVFEGLSFTPDFQKLFVSIEEPLYQDGPRVDVNKNTTPIRILCFNTISKTETNEYAYIPDPVARQAIPADKYKINGISEILAINNHQILLLERSYSTGHLGCVVKIYLADISNATDVKNMKSLAVRKYKPASKKLLINLDSLGFYIDNVEGICFGPKLDNGNQSLLLIADNNFNSFEIAQVFLFEWQP